jgi:putative flippase GtrA
MGKFGVVGALAFVVDNGAYFLLTIGPGHLLAAYPVRASILATLIATAFAYVGNRNWAFTPGRPGAPQTDDDAHPAPREAPGRPPVKEMLAFLAANGVGMAIIAGCLYLSRWVFDFQDAGADAVARNFGIALSTVFRYLAYKFWVFNGRLTGKS